ncbi:Chorismate synthase [Bienertia sinuspersici]
MQRSQNNDPHVTTLPIFMLLKGQITHKALRLLDNEYKRVGEIGEDGDGCGCYMRHTHGLPCAHVMREMEADGSSIQLSDIHPFWKTLDVKASSSQKNSSESFQFKCQHDIDKGLSSSQEQSFSTCFGRARGRPPKTVVDSQSPINSKGQSSTVNNCGRGRGRGRTSEITSESTTKIPSNILPFVDELPSYIIHNVDGDGNCGYRVVAHWLYEDEHRWPTDCQELGFEIEKRFCSI